MDALRNYLSWQAELGGDEVVLPSPLATRVSAPASPATAPSRSGNPFPSPTKPGLAGGGYAPEPALPPSPSLQPPGSVPQPGPAGDGSLFSMLSRSLVDTREASQAARKAAEAPPSTPAARPEANLPAFADLEACREYLEKNVRSLLTGDVQGIGWSIVPGVGPKSASLAVAGLEATAADSQAGLPFQGAAGLLLEKMMRAIHLDLGSLYRTLVVKVAGPGPGRRCYTRRDLVRLLPLFQAELELAKAPVVLLLGEACAQAVLRTGRGLEELRLAPHTLDGAPGREFVVTYHPDELEGNEDLKRKAWKDLQWLQARLQGR